LQCGKTDAVVGLCHFALAGYRKVLDLKHCKRRDADVSFQSTALTKSKSTAAFVQQPLAGESN
jgi:hypothetical protein